jgi:hypothetical protein
MTKLEAIAASKQFRKDADELLQRMKEHRKSLIAAKSNPIGDLHDAGLNVSFTLSEIEACRHIAEDIDEAIAQHTLSTRDLESCIMRQGMALKYIGNPSPYPESYNPASPVVEPTADGLKL